MKKFVLIALISFISFLGFAKTSLATFHNHDVQNDPEYELLCQYELEYKDKSTVRIYGNKMDETSYAVSYQKEGAEEEWVTGTPTEINNIGNFSNAKSMVDVRTKGCPKEVYLDTKTEKELCFLSYADCFVKKNSGTDYFKEFQSTKLTTNNSGKTYTNSTGVGDDPIDIGDFSGEETCEGFLGSKTDKSAPAYYLHFALILIRYLAIILAVVLSVIDFFKAIFSQDKDMLKKASLTSVKRVIFAVLTFFIPIVLEFILGLLGAYTVKCV